MARSRKTKARRNARTGKPYQKRKGEKVTTSRKAVSNTAKGRSQLI